MDIVAVVLMMAGVGYVWAHRTPEPPGPLTQWNEPVNHAKPIQSRPNTDASMATMAVRRRAIAAVHRQGQAFGHKGQDNGVVEAYFLSGICPPLPYAPDILYDGGGAGDEYCAVLDDTEATQARDGGTGETRGGGG